MLRTPPNAIDAEQATLGAALISNRAAELVTTELSGDDFYVPAHRHVHAALVALVGRGAPADQLTLPDELRERGQLDSVGGMAYVLTLADSVPTAAHAEHYGKIVEDKSDRRKLIEVARRLETMAFDEEMPIGDVLEMAERLVLAVRRQKNQRRLIVNALEMGTAEERYYLDRAENRDAQPIGFRTPWEQLDRAKVRLRSGNLVVVAGGTSTGKSSLIRHCCWSVCEQGGSVMLFSLEMEEDEVRRGLVCQQARVDSWQVDEGRLADEEWRRYYARLQRLKSFGDRLAVAYGGYGTVGEVAADARRRKQRFGLDLVAIDYTQLLDPAPTPGGRKTQTTRAGEIAAVSRAQKQLAVELGACVMAASQFNREVDRERGKPPRLSHLKESGSLEQDANQVWMLHLREEWPQAITHETRIPIDLIVGKNRGGARNAVVPFFFSPTYTRFDPADMQHALPEPAAREEEDWYTR